MLEAYLELANNPLVESSCYNELQKERDQLQKELNSQIKRIIRKVNGCYNQIPVSKDVRKAVYERDDYKCLKCGSKIRLSIDHIVPRIKGGSNHINNLQTLCYPCNLIKGDKYIDYRKR